MELRGITWEGPEIDDEDILADLPNALRKLLGSINGFVLFGGALHVRGAARAPAWHSLREAWRGAQSIHRLYPAIQPDDVPFGQDCVGDQYLLRGEHVIRLAAETGEVKALDLPLFPFLERACAEPDEFLSAAPLLLHLNEGGELPPGMLLHAHPPFATQQAAGGVSLRPVPADELLRDHAILARQIGTLPPGAAFRMRVTD
ncbi:MAG TPA: hypothetical protein VF142_18980 [Longimicrobium sp.]